MMEKNTAGWGLEVRDECLRMFTICTHILCFCASFTSDKLSERKRRGPSSTKVKARLVRNMPYVPT